MRVCGVCERECVREMVRERVGECVVCERKRECV